MLQKSYSEGIFLEKNGPLQTTSYASTCHLNNERSFITSVYFVPKLIAKRSYLTVNGNSDETEALVKKALATYNRKCSLSNGHVKSYESSVSIDQSEDIELNGLDDIDSTKYKQNIELVPGLVMKDFSETINIFPRTTDISYGSEISYDESHTKRNYIAGLEVHKFREVEVSYTKSSNKESSFTSSMHINTEQNCNTMNGECEDYL